MALVRCPIHKIPYNDDNPRGCPACAREKEGGDQAELMRELARMSQASQQPPETADLPGRRRTTGATPVITYHPVPVTEQPRAPVSEPGRLSRLLERLVGRRLLTGAVAVAVLAIIGIVVTSGPKFVDGADPPYVSSEAVRALPVEPAASITTVFAVLGTQQPRAVDAMPRLARYSYGDGLTVDAMNRVVHAITLEVPSWSWHGLRVGLEERTTRGALSLLGVAEELPEEGQTAPRTIAGYVTYPSLDARPKRTLRVEVRPPNGCYDAIVELRPRAAGILVAGANRYAVIGQGEAELDWAASLVRIVDRSMPGPYVRGPAACDGRGAGG